MKEEENNNKSTGEIVTDNALETSESGAEAENNDWRFSGCHRCRRCGRGRI